MEEASLQLGSKLSDLEVRILDFERQWWKYAGAKDAAIKELFDLSTRGYYNYCNCSCSSTCARRAKKCRCRF
ncbi:MAG: DUF3263 domain-containing protein [Actinobacteria bacterium]|nr:DUF3263 domain-containing protein [Actinomycetota bacterium]